MISKFIGVFLLFGSIFIQKLKTIKNIQVIVSQRMCLRTNLEGGTDRRTDKQSGYYRASRIYMRGFNYRCLAQNDILGFRLDVL